MPQRAKAICKKAGCGSLIEKHGYCETHKQQAQRQQDQDRGTAYQRGYTSRWAKARAAYLRAHPLCAQCEKDGRLVAAQVVDHIKPHKLKDALDSGDQAAIDRARELFWDSKNNWQSLCKRHHDIKTAKEDGGFGMGNKAH